MKQLNYINNFLNYKKQIIIIDKLKQQKKIDHNIDVEVYLSTNIQIMMETQLNQDFLDE